jgi:hypothetical protein
MGNNEDHAHQWQKITRPLESELEDELEKEVSPAWWARRYLDLADLLINRVQRRVERDRSRISKLYRDAA